MPSPYTFSIKPIGDFVRYWTGQASVVVDPFCGKSEIGTHLNDIRQSGMDAVDFLKDLARKGVVADAVLLDPPYSPRQISEVYKSIGRKLTARDTQNARMMKEVRDATDLLVKPDQGVVLSFGWNSAGMGKTRGYSLVEVLLVSHGGSHNDTICIAEIKNL